MKHLNSPLAGILLALSLCMIPPAHPADDSATIAATLRDKALRDTLAWEMVSEITTRFGPRPAGSGADHAAAQWLADKLRALDFANVAVERFPMTAWTRGAESVEILTPAPQRLVAAAL